MAVDGSLLSLQILFIYFLLNNTVDGMLSLTFLNIPVHVNLKQSVQLFLSAKFGFSLSSHGLSVSFQILSLCEVAVTFLQ